MSVTLVVLAIFARAMIPVGYMPGDRDDGTFTMVICSGFGTQTITVDAHGQPINDEDHNQAGEHCPFAPVLAGDVPPPITFVAAQAPYSIFVDFWSDHIRDRNAIARASSRAPPSFV
ncbi:DUF2946 family protein [Micavibrio aeruginosavorus]|uniref:DUF2946 domain-containing protein n=1 Tax=Micavibrio aeruginosavorus EPB TaxID=349215 RepID=M4VF74_9BACT|nr:DUF2946 family protein [Micavibrio aeruginosavorus]AGH98002.1 hypothetical protein A11S_1188 [Micavibrio aeruginosavorus EPB]